MRRSRSKIQRVAASLPCLFFCFLPSITINAFPIGPELFQAFDAAREAAPQIDEVLFAAVNLLGPQRRPLVNTIIAPAPSQIITMPNITIPKSFSLFVGGDNEVQQPLSYTISLTKEEIELFQLVRKVRDQCCPSTTLRIGGGWVRDKLLNRYQVSPDIDFVLDNKSGIEFAKLVDNFLLAENKNGGTGGGQTKNECILTSALKDYTDVAESQHLQTASLRIGDLDVDFNQCRFEKYKPNSRVPSEAGVASIVEDAFRRDLTINSLYYNLNSNQVEDWTEQGLRDLRFRNIRTPTAPLSTLLEDPLRILRAIRFSSQLSFSLDQTLKDAALDKRVKHSLQQKVSRERIGKEVDNIFKSADPRRGIQLFMETKLIDLVFPLQEGALEEDKVSPFTADIFYQAGYDQLFRTQLLVSRIFTENKQSSQESLRFLWYAAFFKPLGQGAENMPSKNDSTSTAESIRSSELHRLLVKSLKQSVKDVRAVESVINGACMLERSIRLYNRSSSLMQSLDPKDDSMIAVVKEKKAAQIRWLGYKMLQRIGPYWRESLILALSSSPENFAPLKAIDRYNELVSFSKNRVGLSGKILAMKPILNGEQIKQLLPGIEGKHFRKVLKAQERWQVEHYADRAAVAGDQWMQDEVAQHLRTKFPHFQ